MTLNIVFYLWNSIIFSEYAFQSKGDPMFDEPQLCHVKIMKIKAKPFYDKRKYKTKVA